MSDRGAALYPGLRDGLLELADAVERMSQAMLDDYEIIEEPVGGGLVASRTMVRVSYNDLRIVLACADEAAALYPALGEGCHG